MILALLKKPRVPQDHFQAFVEHLASIVAPGGRLILGAYGNRSRGVTPAPIDRMLGECGYTVSGTASAGVPEMARFA